MPMIKMPVKSNGGAPMKLLPTLTVADVTKAIAAIRNMAWWKSAGIRSFSAIGAKYNVNSPRSRCDAPVTPPTSRPAATVVRLRRPLAVELDAGSQQYGPALDADHPDLHARP